MNKKAEDPTSGTMMTIVHLILSVIFFIVLFTILVTILNLLAVKPDSSALAFYNRMVSNLEHLEPGMSMTEILFQVEEEKVRSERGYWAIMNFGRDRDPSGIESFSCPSIGDDSATFKITRHPSHSMKCKTGQPCSCLVFFTRDSPNEVTYSKCQAIDTKYDLENYCMALYYQETNEESISSKIKYDLEYMIIDKYGENEFACKNKGLDDALCKCMHYVYSELRRDTWLPPPVFNQNAEDYFRVKRLFKISNIDDLLTIEMEKSHYIGLAEFIFSEYEISCSSTPSEEDLE